jgi:hypothetical protein
MAVLGTIVQAFMLSVFDTGYDNLLCGSVASQFVCNYHSRYHALLLK